MIARPAEDPIEIESPNGVIQILSQKQKSAEIERALPLPAENRRKIGDGLGKYQAHYWRALQAHAQAGRRSMHALPIGGEAKSIRNSKIPDVYSFYKEFANILQFETSATVGLDSLHHPLGSLKAAQTQAARIFDADHAFFVTSGTTVSNNIVARAAIRYGQHVLIDSSCHKSWHYALAAVNARANYLPAYQIPKHSLVGIVPIKTIIDKLTEYKKTNKLHEIGAIILTNITFDGVMYPMVDVLRAIYDIKHDATVIVDQAWFVHGDFHPRYESGSALKAARKLEREGYNVDIWVTTSMHKMASCLRQGSAIFHIGRERFSEQKFRWAYNWLETTSPNTSILASIDVAIVQLAEEGEKLLQRSIDIAEWLHFQCNKRGIKTLKSTDLITTEYLAEGVDLDPTRVTISLRESGLCGGDELKRRFMSDYNLQFNKAGFTTALLKCHIGVDFNDIIATVEALEELRGCTNQPLPEPVPFPTFGGWAERFTEICGSGDIGLAYELANLDSFCEYLSPSEVLKRLQKGEEIVYASMPTPYPTGAPTGIWGEKVTIESIQYLIAVDQGGREIHDYEAALGLRVFKRKALYA